MKVFLLIILLCMSCRTHNVISDSNLLSTDELKFCGSVHTSAFFYSSKQMCVWWKTGGGISKVEIEWNDSTPKSILVPVNAKYMYGSQVLFGEFVNEVDGNKIKIEFILNKNQLPIHAYSYFNEGTQGDRLFLVEESELNGSSNNEIAAFNCKNDSQPLSISFVENKNLTEMPVFNPPLVGDRVLYSNDSPQRKYRLDFCVNESPEYAKLIQVIEFSQGLGGFVAVFTDDASLGNMQAIYNESDFLYSVNKIPNKLIKIQGIEEFIFKDKIDNFHVLLPTAFRSNYFPTVLTTSSPFDPSPQEPLPEDVTVVSSAFLSGVEIQSKKLNDGSFVIVADTLEAKNSHNLTDLVPTGANIGVGGLELKDVIVKGICKPGESSELQNFKLSDNVAFEATLCLSLGTAGTSPWRIAELKLVDNNLPIGSGRDFKVDKKNINDPEIFKQYYNHHNFCDSIFLKTPNAVYSFTTGSTSMGGSIEFKVVEGAPDCEDSANLAKYKIKYGDQTAQEGSLSCKHPLRNIINLQNNLPNCE